MDIYTAEQEIGIETTDLLGPRLTLEEAQQLCQDREDRRSGWLLRWTGSADGTAWEAPGFGGFTYWIMKWEL